MFFIVFITCVSNASAATIKSLYGDFKTQDPLALKLIQHQTMQRLKYIDNAGAARYFNRTLPYSLFDHALGVYVLLNRYKVTDQEQIAGMLEPVAHTVFAHRGANYIRVKNSDLPYYLAAQQFFAKRTGLEKILGNFDLSMKDLSPVQEQYPALNKNPPELAITEIEMSLRLAFTYKLLTRTEIAKILDALEFEDGKWTFTDQDKAEQFARLSLYFAERYWGAPENYLIDRWMGQAIQYAIREKILTLQQVQFGTDRGVIKILTESSDRKIRAILLRCKHVDHFFEVLTEEGPYDILYKPEFRGLDPEVKLSFGRVKKLSKLDSDFAADFLALKTRFEKGIRIRLMNPGNRKVKGFSPASTLPDVGKPFDVSVGE